MKAIECTNLSAAYDKRLLDKEHAFKSAVRHDSA